MSSRKVSLNKQKRNCDLIKVRHCDVRKQNKVVTLFQYVILSYHRKLIQE